MNNMIRLSAVLISCLFLFTACSPSHSASIRPTASVQKTAVATKTTMLSPTPAPGTTATPAPTPEPTAVPTSEPALEPTPQPTPTGVVNEYGNSNGNVINGGTAAIQGEWIFYNGNFAYRIRTDGTGKTLIKI
jgi:hypothetical protein